MTDYYLSQCLQLSPFCVFIRLYQEIRLIKKKNSERQSLEKGIDSNHFFSFSERLSRKLDRMKLNEKITLYATKASKFCQNGVHEKCFKLLELKCVKRYCEIIVRLVIVSKKKFQFKRHSLFLF